MAYIIGNTTVISNNAALGAIDGNSLNLANNPNLSGGGGVKVLNSSTNFPASDLGSTGAVALMAGGGGGNVGNTNFGGLGSGGGECFSLSPGGTVTLNVGGGGFTNNGNPANPAGDGGTSSLSYPGSQSARGGGGNKARGQNQGFGNGNPGAGYSAANGTVYPNKSNRGVAGYSAAIGV